MKIRIIKIKEARHLIAIPTLYYNSPLYALQRKRWYGWEELMNGSEESCRGALYNLEKHGTIQPILVEKDI